MTQRFGNIFELSDCIEYIIQITNVVESINGKQTLKDVNIKFPISRPYRDELALTWNGHCVREA